MGAYRNNALPSVIVFQLAALLLEGVHQAALPKERVISSSTMRLVLASVSTIVSWDCSNMVDKEDKEQGRD